MNQKKITIKDLKKEMMLAKKDNKDKAKAMVMLIDTIEKMAKSKNPKNPEPDLFINDGLKRYIKQVEDSIRNGVSADKELQILTDLAERILPKQLTEAEIDHIITEYLLDKPDTNMGQIMGYLKKNYTDQLDMKIASKLVNQKLKSK